MCGCVIYKIYSKSNKKVYVGSAVNFSKRKYYHLYNLRLNKHHSPNLQNSYNKYGESDLCFKKIEDVDGEEKLIEREQYWIDRINPKFNYCKVAGSPLGIKHTIKSKRNMSKAHIGKKLSKETIRKRSIKQCGKNHWNYGKSVPKGRKVKISNSMKRYHKKNKHHQKGIPIKESTKQKIREAIWVPIIQYDLSGNLIREWDGIKIASDYLKIHSSNICQCLKGKAKTTGGFKWKYKEI